MKILKCLLVVCVTVALIEMIIYVSDRSAFTAFLNRTVGSFASSEIVVLAAIGICVGAFACRFPKIVDWKRALAGEMLLRAVLIGVLLAGFCYALKRLCLHISLALLAPETEPVWQKIEFSPVSVLQVVFLLLSAFAEEILWRGCLAAYIQKYLGDGWAFAISSIGFALWHLTGDASGADIPYLLVGGMCFFLLWKASGYRLWCCTAFHATGNLLNTLFSAHITFSFSIKTFFGLLAFPLFWLGDVAVLATVFLFCRSRLFAPPLPMGASYQKED